MAKDPRFNFYPDNWVGGTEGFTLEQEGAYLALIIMQSKVGRFTLAQAQDKLMQKTRGNTAVCTELLNFLIPKFCTDGNLFWSERLEKEIEKSRNHSEKQKERISKRWNKSGTNSGNTAVLPVNRSGIGNGSSINSFGKSENLFFGDVPEDLMALSAKLEMRETAGEWHDYVQEEVESLGYQTTREHPVKFDDQNGRIDLVATKGQKHYAIELDYRTPREKSIKKVKAFGSGMILLRNPKIVKLQGEKQKPDTESPTLADYELWTEDAKTGNDWQFTDRLRNSGLHANGHLADYADSHLALLAQYPKKAPPTQHAFRISLINHIKEKLKQQPHAITRKNTNSAELIPADKKYSGKF